MANRTKRTTVKDNKFFKALSEYPNVTAACEQAGYNRGVVYDARHKDQKFYDKWEAAWSKGIDALEEEMMRRAIKGVAEPVYQGGKLVGTKRNYSDTLAIFMAKGARPKKYREQQLHEHAADGGGPVQHVVTLISPKAKT
jgi:hypothetical protein